MKKSIQVGNVVAAPGEVKLGKLDCGYMPDSSVVSMPLIVINGNHEGPTLLMTAVIHGTEITGVEVIRRVTREIIKPQELKGSIIAVPIINPFAFCAHTPNTPQDGYNLNRVFPGDPESLLSHRLADLVYNELVLKCDYIIDLHANAQPAMQFAIVKNSADNSIFQKSMGMAEAYGITIIEMMDDLEPQLTGTMTDCAVQKGVACLVLELVSQRRIEEHSVLSGVKGTLNVMKYLEMIDGQVEQQDIPKLDGHLSRIVLTANKGGLIHHEKQIGQWVKKDELIGVIRDPWGDIVEEIHSPRDCWILATPLKDQTCTTGDLLAMLAFPKDS